MANNVMPEVKRQREALAHGLERDQRRSGDLRPDAVAGEDEDLHGVQSGLAALLWPRSTPQRRVSSAIKDAKYWAVVASPTGMRPMNCSYRFRRAGSRSPAASAASHAACTGAGVARGSARAFQ